MLKQRRIFRSRVVLALIGSLLLGGISQPAASADGTCLIDSSASVNQSATKINVDQTLTITFNAVGGGCTADYFLAFQSASSHTTSGVLDSSVTTRAITPSSLPTGADDNFQTVTYTYTVLASDVGRYLQFSIQDDNGLVANSSVISVRPSGYALPQSGVVTVAISRPDGIHPSYNASIGSVTGSGTLTNVYKWWDCGVDSLVSTTAAYKAKNRSSTAPTNCSLSGTQTSGYSPFAQSNHVLVAEVDVSDNYGGLTKFFSSAKVTPTFAVSSVTKTSANRGGGESITVNGTGLELAVVRWQGGLHYGAEVTNVSTTQLTFLVPASEGTSASFSILTAGGQLDLSPITLTRDTVSSLTGLAISVGTLSPTFASNVYSYTATVSSSTTSITVTPTFTGYAETATVNSAQVTSGSSSSSISLSYGENTVTLIGTADNGATTTYTLIVTRTPLAALSAPNPTALATIGSSNSIDLSWAAISNAISYTVKKYDSSGTTLLQTISNVSGTTLTSTGLTAKTIYKFSVTAIADGTNNSSSLESTKVAAVTGSVSTAFTRSGSTITASAFEAYPVSAVTSALPSGSYTYQWFGGSDTSTLTSISSVTSSPSYTPTASDRSYSAQKYLAVKVVATISGSDYSFTSPAVPVYTYPNSTGASVTADTSGTYNGGKYKVGQTVIGHPWQIMGTPWPKLSYQWYICANPAALGTPASSCTKAPGQDLNDVAHGALETPLDCEGRLNASVTYDPISGSYPVCSIVTYNGASYIAHRPAVHIGWLNGAVGTFDGYYFSAFNALSHGISTHVGGSSGSDLGNPYDLGNYNFAYEVPTDAEGKYLTFTQTLTNAATDQTGTPFTLTQTRVMSSGIVNSAPGTSGTPDISGTPTVGSRLTASAVTYTGSPVGSISYEWKYATTETGTYTSFSPAVKSQYFTPQSAHIGKWVKAFAVATSKSGDVSAPAPSASPALIMGAAYVPTVQYVMRSSSYFMLYFHPGDNTFTLSATISSGPPDARITYQGSYNGYYRVDVSGLAPRQSATVTVTATRGGYNAGVKSATWSSSS
jgi:Cadherin-like beta sandwich domain